MKRFVVLALLLLGSVSSPATAHYRGFYGRAVFVSPFQAAPAVVFLAPAAVVYPQPVVVGAAAPLPVLAAPTVAYLQTLPAPSQVLFLQTYYGRALGLRLRAFHFGPRSVSRAVKVRK